MKRTEEKLTAESRDKILRAAERVLGKLEVKIRKSPEEEDLKRYYILGKGSIWFWKRSSYLRPLTFYDGAPEALLTETADKVPELQRAVSRIVLFPLDYTAAWADTRRFLSEMTEIVSASTEYLLSMGAELDNTLRLVRLASGDGLRQRFGKDMTENAVTDIRDMLLQTARENLDETVGEYAGFLSEEKLLDFNGTFWMYLQMLAYCETYNEAMKLYDEWLGVPVYSLTDSLDTTAFFDLIESRRKMSSRLKEETLPELTGLLSLQDGYWDPIAHLLDRADGFPTTCEMTDEDRTDLRKRLRGMGGKGLQFELQDVSSIMARRMALETGIK